MTYHQSALPTLIQELLDDPDAARDELFRRLLQAGMQDLVDAEAAVKIGAGRYERSWAAPFIRSGRCASRRFPIDGCIAERSRRVRGSRAMNAGGRGCIRSSSRRSRPGRGAASRSC